MFSFSGHRSSDSESEERYPSDEYYYHQESVGDDTFEGEIGSIFTAQTCSKRGALSIGADRDKILWKHPLGDNQFMVHGGNSLFLYTVADGGIGKPNLKTTNVTPTDGSLRKTEGFSVTKVAGKVYAFGGGVTVGFGYRNTKTTVLNTLHILSLDTLSWEIKTYPGPTEPLTEATEVTCPVPMSSHFATCLEDKLVLMNGRTVQALGPLVVIFSRPQLLGDSTCSLIIADLYDTVGGQHCKRAEISHSESDRSDLRDSLVQLSETKALSTRLETQRGSGTVLTLKQALISHGSSLGLSEWEDTMPVRRMMEAEFERQERAIDRQQREAGSDCDW
ncbi:hypothetical protein KIPB_002050 [Kipferlia bialata]|uniref:Uncharacterized protein n=1 Tax=Kipferlia bialata TaxID=797122 RepID=A0A9K3CR79_9EUKA|nr:hypothetical protein KIPB_002050 [Kipferlia bialata]|eukprot:g2050.t1